MEKEKITSQTQRVLQALTKGGLGCVPLVGPLLGELAGLANTDSEEVKQALGRIGASLGQQHSMLEALATTRDESSGDIANGLARLIEILEGREALTDSLSLHGLAEKALASYAPQSTGSLGANAVQIQIQGNGNTICLGESSRLTFSTSDEKKARREALAEPSDLDLLLACNRITTFVGRDEMLDDFVSWALSTAPFAVRQLTGDAGAGKTRFAIELLRVLNAGQHQAPGHWTGGFLNPESLRDFRIPQAGYSGWRCPAMLVLDYASFMDGDALKDVLLALYQSTTRSGMPVRVLLLNRQADDGSYSWLRPLGEDESSDRPNLRKVVESPIQLEPLDSPELRLGIFRQTYDQVSTRHKKEPLGTKALATSMLAAEQWKDPLIVMMAAVVAAHQGDIPMVLNLSRRDLAKELAIGENRRLLMGLDKQTAAPTMDFRRLLAGASILARGLESGSLEIIAEVAAGISDLNKADCRKQTQKMRDLLPVRKMQGDTRKRLAIGFVQPDIVAEALILHLFKGFQDAEIQPLLKALVAEEGYVVQMLGLCIQDFASRWDHETLSFSDSRKSDEKKDWARRLLSWFEFVISEASEVDLSTLFRIADQLPEGLFVVDHAVRIYGLILERLDMIDGLDEMYRESLRAVTLNNLGNRLSDLGRREEALVSAQEAVEIRRQLAELRPEAFLPDLAMSLNNLGNRLSALGRREEALVSAQEATGIYRQLAELRPEAFLPDLAMSLGALQSIQQSSEAYDEAHKTVVEAITLINPFFIRLPQAHFSLLQKLIGAYLKIIKQLNIEPDIELLTPLFAFIQSQQSTEDSAES